MDFVKVDSKKDSWHGSISLEPNKIYWIIPSSASRYTINGGATYDDFHGSANMHGGEIHVPHASLRVGGLTILVWHHQGGDDATPEIIVFPPGKHQDHVQMGPHGGSMHFLIADRANTWGDNSGLCDVTVAKDEDVSPAIFPIVKSADGVVGGFARWSVSSTGLIDCTLRGRKSGLFGSAKFSTCLVLTRPRLNGGNEAVHYSPWVTMTVGADAWDGENSKSRDFTNLPRIPQSDLNDARGGFVKLARNKSGGTLMEIITGAFEDAEDFVDTSDALYKKVKDSEVVQDIIVATLA